MKLEEKMSYKRLTHPRSNGIKKGFWSPNKKDELIARLAEYEETGLSPLQVMELKKGGKQ